MVHPFQGVTKTLQKIPQEIKENKITIEKNKTNDVPFP